MNVYAQEKWTKEDSIWLQRVLSGEEKLQLNEETRKAIQSGKFISTDPSESQKMLLKPAELPIVKSFEGITAPEKNTRKDPSKLPPSVYSLYGTDQKDTIPEAKKAVDFSPKIKAELATLRKMNPIKTTVDDKNTLPAPRVAFSAEDLMRRAFWPSHRAKKRNAKRANAWKSYNQYE